MRKFSESHSPAFRKIQALLLHPLTWLAVALALRLAYLLDQQARSVLFYQPLLDEEEMARAARQLLAGGGFGPEPLFKAPLYPLWLAGVMWASGGGWFFTARLAQHLLGVLLVLVGWDSARIVAGGGRRGRLAGAFAAAALALYGPLIRLEDSLILDFFAVLLQSAMLWALLGSRTSRHSRATHRKTAWWAALAGVFAAASWLNRPTITPVLPLLALWIVWDGAIPLSPFRIPHFSASGLLRAAIFLLIPLLAMGAVWRRNARAGGEAMVLPWQGGFNFYYANGLKANGKYLVQEGFSLAGSGNPTRELAVSVPGTADGLSRNSQTGGSGSPVRHSAYFHSINHYWMSRAWGEIAADPARWIGLMGRKMLYLATSREIYNFEDYDVQRAMSPILRRLPFSFGVLWPLALGGLALCVGRLCRKRLKPAEKSKSTALAPDRIQPAPFILFWLYLLSLGFAIALYFVSGRLRMPLVFPAAVLAGVALADFRESRIFFNFHSAIRNPKTAMLILLIALGGAMSWGDWWGVRSESHRHLEYARLSNAAWRAGEYARALEYADACAREPAAHPGVPLLRGQALYSLGRTADAAQAFEASLARLPDDPVAPYNLGIIAYYDHPDPPRAAAMFEEALRRQPAYAQAAWMAALARLRLGDPARARALLAPYLPPREGAPEKLLTVAAALAREEKDEPSFRSYAASIEKSGGPEAVKRLNQELSGVHIQ